MRENEQDFCRAILTLLVEHGGLPIAQIAAALRAQGEDFTDEELPLACENLRKSE